MMKKKVQGDGLGCRKDGVICDVAIYELRRV